MQKIIKKNQSIKPSFILTTRATLTQDFQNNSIKNKYGYKADMLLTDTDSLMYKMETGNVYEDLYKDKELLDFNNYPKD